MKNFALAAFVIFTSACSPSQEGADAVHDSKKRWIWTEAPELSFVHYGISAENNKKAGRSDVQEIYRCWKRANRFHCLTVYEEFNTDSAAGALAPLTRLMFVFSTDKLPQGHVRRLDDGYECDSSPSFNTFNESVTRDGRKLISNDVSSSGASHELSGSPWSGDFVKEFKLNNKITGNSFFNCAGLDAILSNGSQETVNSTVISYADLMLE